MYTNTPLALLSTPKFETGKVSANNVCLNPLRACNPLTERSIQDEPFTIEASHMALSHNAFIRGYNSIYQQAPRIQSLADKVDFAGYCVAWVDCVLQHHHYEETELFPNLNKAAGQKDLMTGAVHQHEAFYGGMEELKKYLLEKGGDFSSREVIRIMESFQEPLYNHLKAEPGEIVALAKYSTAEKPIDILGIANTAGEFVSADPDINIRS